MRFIRLPWRTRSREVMGVALCASLLISFAALVQPAGAQQTTIQHAENVPQHQAGVWYLFSSEDVSSPQCPADPAPGKRAAVTVLDGPNAVIIDAGRGQAAAVHAHIFVTDYDAPQTNVSGGQLETVTFQARAQQLAGDDPLAAAEVQFARNYNGVADGGRTKGSLQWSARLRPLTASTGQLEVFTPHAGSTGKWKRVGFNQSFPNPLDQQVTLRVTADVLGEKYGDIEVMIGLNTWVVSLQSLSPGWVSKVGQPWRDSTTLSLEAENEAIQPTDGSPCLNQQTRLRYDLDYSGLVSVTGTGLDCANSFENDLPCLAPGTEPAPSTCGGRFATVELGRGETPTSGHDVIVGTAGDDIIRGLGGNDRICGGDGDDRLFGGAGRDWIWGNLGNDIVKGDSGIDRLSGGQGDDKLWGGSGKDWIWGGGGEDRILGEEGPDILDGGNAADTILGGDGDDDLIGGTGGDVLRGEAGDDELDGGVGNDRCIDAAGTAMISCEIT